MIYLWVYLAIGLVQFAALDSKEFKDSVAATIGLLLLTVLWPVAGALTFRNTRKRKLARAAWKVRNQSNAYYGLTKAWDYDERQAERAERWWAATDLKERS